MCKKQICRLDNETNQKTVIKTMFRLKKEYSYYVSKNMNSADILVQEKCRNNYFSLKVNPNSI